MQSRPSAPFSLWLATGPRPATTFNDHEVPAWGGFSDADAQTIWSIVRDAWKWWNINVTTEQPASSLWAAIGFAPAFGNYPGGGQANVGSWQSGGIQAWVFTDRLQNNPTYCGLDAVHESGHVMGGFQDAMELVSGSWQYTPGLWMGMPIPVGIWTPDQRSTLDSRFGCAADLNFDGRVDKADAEVLRGPDGYTAAEAVAVARGFQGR